MEVVDDYTSLGEYFESYDDYKPLIKTETILTSEINCMSLSDIQQNADTNLCQKDIKSSPHSDDDDKMSVVDPSAVWDHEYISKAEQIDIKEELENVNLQDIDYDIITSTPPSPAQYITIEPNTTRTSKGIPQSSNEYTETIDTATSLHPKTFEFGDLNIIIQETPHVKKSTATGYHVVRGCGNMEMSVSTTQPLSNNKYYIRTTLIRKHEDQRHNIINMVCKKHIKCTDPELKDHVLQTKSAPGTYYYDDEGLRKSICFHVSNTQDDINIPTVISVKFICASTCNLTKGQFSVVERGREMYLIVTLECKETNSIVARRKIDIWPKAAISLRDMCKLTRLSQKGAKAQWLMKKKEQRHALLKQKCIHITSLAKRHGCSKDEIKRIIDQIWDIPT